MVRLDSATLERSAKRFVAVAEGVCAITLNKNEPIEFLVAQAVNHPFLAVRKCKTSISSTAVNVSLDNTNLAWSPNLHLRLLQLWVESADFRNIFTEKEITPVDDGTDYCIIKLIQTYQLFFCCNYLKIFYSNFRKIGV